ncbi:MAG TPA: 2-C-methyl-D-erythritol 2,4-cyclodiphosphate synthase [Thermomicrobiaceae bacterium]|nr:2-C-methyl-D-erythritol 2,4-cyclodiphosphate synthase [Thermomicrobiaceae bacterium]
MSRVGIGYDVHRLVAGRPLVLGGVTIPSPLGLEGHSDADVLLHALMDALLGAAGLGDIGEHFPPSDARWRDADSRDLLARVRALIEDRFRVGNVDLVLIAEAPRVAPFRAAMRAEVARVLRIPEGAVNLKATTNERLGFVGRGEGLAALAVVLLEERAERVGVDAGPDSTGG